MYGLDSFKFTYTEWFRLSIGSGYRVVPDTEWFRIPGGSGYRVVPDTGWFQIPECSRYRVVSDTEWFRIPGGSRYRVASHESTMCGRYVQQVQIYLKIIASNERQGLHSPPEMGRIGGYMQWRSSVKSSTLLSGSSISL